MRHLIPKQNVGVIGAQSAELRLILLFLTVVGFFVYFIGKRTVGPHGVVCVEMKRGKAFMLLAIYFVFVFYIVSLGYQADWATQLSQWLQATVLPMIPKIGS